MTMGGQDKNRLVFCNFGGQLETKLVYGTILR